MLSFRLSASTQVDGVPFEDETDITLSPHPFT